MQGFGMVSILGRVISLKTGNENYVQVRKIIFMVNCELVGHGGVFLQACHSLNLIELYIFSLKQHKIQDLEKRYS